MAVEKNYYNELDFKYKVPIQIRFDDIDGMGHVNNTVLMSYFDYGKVRYFLSLNSEIASVKKVPFIIAHYETDFYVPVFANEEIFVQTKLVEIGEKSITFVQRVVAKDVVKCVCKTVMACFDFETQHSKPVPENFKKLIQEAEN